MKVVEKNSNTKHTKGRAIQISVAKSLYLHETCMDNHNGSEWTDSFLWKESAVRNYLSFPDNCLYSDKKQCSKWTSKRDTPHEQVFCKNTRLDILFVNVYTIEINSATVRREWETHKIQGEGGKIKQAEKEREKKRERLFKNCFSLLGLLYIVH
jgi:hypothetical protein